MGVLFESGDELVWSPSPGLARVFLAQLRVLEELVGLPSGIGELVADEVEVDATVLRTFVVATMEHMETASATLKSLMAGPFAVAVGIASGCGQLPPARGAERHLALRGVALIGGRGRTGPIYEGLAELND